jgi:hypothetical protein
MLIPLVGKRVTFSFSLSFISPGEMAPSHQTLCRNTFATAYFPSLKCTRFYKFQQEMLDDITLHNVVPSYIVYLSNAFSSVFQYLQMKLTGPVYFQWLIMDLLSRHFTRSGTVTRSDMHIRSCFSTQQSVESWCISRIIDQYIDETATLVKSVRFKSKYKELLQRAKSNWQNRWLLRLQKELYLGYDSFEEELNRSCAEFYQQAKLTLGGTPV